MLKVLLIPLCLMIAKTGHDHAVYISVLEIDQQQMSIKVFTDDLQDAIRNDSKSFVPSGEEAFPTANRTAIQAYFQKEIQLKINGKKVGFQLEQTELKGDSYWITMKLDAHEKWSSFSLHATYFMELFPDQTNVVKIKVEKPKFFRLTKSNPGCRYTI